MKTLAIKGMLSVVILVMLSGCEIKERARLHQELDSLKIELEKNSTLQQTLNEVGVLIDTIDANRRALSTKIVEGTSYADYVFRLREINQHIKATEKKLSEMTLSMKHTNRATAAIIKRLKTGLELRVNEINALQVEIANAREENKSLSASVNRKDSVLLTKEDVIKRKDTDILNLQSLVTDVTEQNKVKVANLYFAQAEALETAAMRTKFAPRKKKETRREALELYRLSMSLGNTEAQQKIDKLEKELG